MALTSIRERITNLATILSGTESNQQLSLYMLEGIIRDCMTYDVNENVISLLLEAYYSVEGQSNISSNSTSGEYKAPSEVNVAGIPKFTVTEPQLLFFVG